MNSPTFTGSLAAGLTLLPFLVFLPAARAALVPVSSVIASTTYAGQDPVRTINGSGITGAMTTEGEVSIATHDNSSFAGSMWHGAVVTPPAAGQWLVFNLAAASNVRTLYYWNHNQAGLIDRGIQNVTIKVSKDNGATYTSVGDFVLEQASGSATERCKILELPATQTGVTNIRFDIVSNYGGIVVGLSEIRFSDQPVVAPDPVVSFFSDEGIVLNSPRNSPGERMPVTLEWQSTGLSNVTISPGVGSVDVTGFTQVTPPPGVDTVYTLSGQGASKSFSYPVTVRTVAGGSSAWRYVRFTPMKLRDGAAANSIQVAELLFFDADGEPVAPISAANPGGDNPGGQEPGMAVDGDPVTKWLDFNRAPLVIDFGANPQSFVDYQFITGGDEPARDPVRWVMEGSNDQSSWTLIDNVTAFDYPLTQNRTAPSSMIPLPGSSLKPYVTFTSDAALVPVGDPVHLTWQVQGAASVNIDHGVGSVSATGGTVTVSPTTTTVYTLTATAAAGGHSTAAVNVQVQDFPVKTIAYANFNASAGELSLLGSAAVLSDARATADSSAAKRLRITGDSSSISGAAWFRKRQTVAAGFESTFALNFINFSPDPFGGADGMVFVLQNSTDGLNALPTQFPERGLAANALNLTFDSYQNDDEESSATLQVRSGATLLKRVDLAPLLTLSKPGDLTQTDAAAAPYAVRVVYAPGDLDIYMNGVLVVDSLNVDLAAIGAVDAQGTAFAGFLARTGGAYEAHDVTAWTLTPADAAIVPLKLTAYTVNPANGAVSLTWASTSGKTYRIAASADLANWTTVLRSGIAAGTGGSTTSTTTFTPGAVRFFRVEEQP